MADSLNEILGIGAGGGGANVAAVWPMQDDAANTVVEDIGPNSLDATWTGGDNTEDHSVTGPNSWLPKALNTDTHYANAGDQTEFNFGTSDFTIFQYYRKPYSGIGFHWYVTAGGGSGDWYSLGKNLATNRFFIDDGSNDSHADWTNHQDGTWRTHAGVRDGNTLRYYQEGSEVDTDDASSVGDIDVSGTDLLIGIIESSPASLAEADFALTCMFDTALTADEIAEFEDGFEPVNTVAPVVSGTETQGETLSVTTGSWGLPSPFSGGTNGTITYAYQWTRSDDGTGTNEADISGATSSTYTLQAADVGKYIRCRVRASNDGGYEAAADTNSDFTGSIASSGGAGPTVVGPYKFGTTTRVGVYKFGTATEVGAYKGTV